MNFLDTITAKLPFSKKEETSEYYFALNIGLNCIEAAVWEMRGAQVSVLGESSESYHGNEELLDRSFKVLDESLGVLEIEPTKIIFGVPDSWNMDDNLKEPYLKLLREILKEYDLQPLAYVTSTHALSYLLQKQEGAPPTAILLGLGEFIEVSLVRGGKVLSSKAIKRNSSLFEDIEAILTQFTEVEVLPSRIMLYSTKEGENLTKIRDELMSYPWMQRLSFLHFPKIEILEVGILARSIIFAAASEINPEIDIKHSFSVAKKTAPIKTGLHSLGKTVPLTKSHPTSSEPQEDIGFVKGDIKAPHPHLTRAKPLNEVVANVYEEVEDTVEDVFDGGKTPRFINKIKNTFMHLIAKPKALIKSDRPKAKLVLIPIVVLAILGLYLGLSKATVTVFVEPKILEKSTEVIADPNAKQVDEAKKIIPGSTIETTVTGSGKASASGTKKIGDPAKGKVVIYNKTASKLSLSQGTTLNSNNGLKFTLDTSVQVSSRSSYLTADGETTKWGKSDPVNITASAIGPESNLASETQLIVNGYNQSDVYASIDQALSGGTSKEVTVVTSDDQKKLQAKVLDELKQKAEEELKAKESSGRKVIADSFSVVDAKYSFSKQVNDQASEFSLNATIRFKGTSYMDTDLRTIVSKLVEVNIPEGYQMNLSDAETQAEIAKVEKDGRLIFNAKFQAKLVPKFDLSSLKSQIRGKSVDGAVQKLKELENIVGAEISLQPPLPGPLGRIPFLDRNIDVTISPK